MRGWALAVVILAVLVPTVVWLAEFLALDDCFDRGGVFDFTTGQRDFVAVHGRYVPFFQRHRLLAKPSTSTGLVGLALFAAGLAVESVWWLAADSPPSLSLGPLASLARLAAERPTVRRHWAR